MDMTRKPSEALEWPCGGCVVPSPSSGKVAWRSSSRPLGAQDQRLRPTTVHLAQALGGQVNACGVSAFGRDPEKSEGFFLERDCGVAVFEAISSGSVALQLLFLPADAAHAKRKGLREGMASLKLLSKELVCRPFGT